MTTTHNEREGANTMTMDWANEIVETLTNGWADLMLDDRDVSKTSAAKQLATALRKAKADGMREAARIVAELVEYGDLDMINLRDELIAASKLDPPT